jgi:hypothetical protein
MDSGSNRTFQPAHLGLLEACPYLFETAETDIYGGGVGNHRSRR